MIIELRYAIPALHRRVFEFAYEEALGSLRDRRRRPLCELHVSESNPGDYRLRMVWGEPRRGRPNEGDHHRIVTALRPFAHEMTSIERLPALEAQQPVARGGWASSRRAAPLKPPAAER
jgi:hypothetical protein